MSRQTKEYDELYSNIELIPDEAIKDTEDGQGFDVDWELVEEKYQKRHQHHSGHHQSGHSHKHHTGQSHRHSSQSKHSSDKGRNGKKSKVSEKKWSRKKKIFIGILIFFFILIVGLISAFFILRHLGKQTMLNYEDINITVPAGVDYEDDGRTVYYKGHTYQFNENIASVLFMGIDNRELKENATAGTAGQAAVSYTHLPSPRDCS